MTVRIPKTLLVALALIVGLGGVGAGAFFIGRESVDTDRHYERGHDRGEALGKRLGYVDGSDATEARFRPGNPDYEAIFVKGRKEGFRTGKREGLGSGRREGFSEGQDSAFQGYGGGWEIGRWYIIQIGQGKNGSKYSIPSRLIMDTGEGYRICSDDADEICGGSLDG